MWGWDIWPGHKCERPSEKSMGLGHPPKRDLLQAGTEAAVSDTIQMGCSCHCSQICDSPCPAAAPAAPTATVPQSCAEVSYAGTARDGAAGRGGGKKEEGGNPRVELVLEVKFLLHEMLDIPFPSVFMSV